MEKKSVAIFSLAILLALGCQDMTIAPAPNQGLRESETARGKTIVPTITSAVANVVLCLDVSGSIDDSELQLEIDGLKDCLNQLPQNGNVSVGIAVYGETSDTALGLTDVTAATLPTIHQALQDLHDVSRRVGTSATNIHAGIDEARGLLAGGSGSTKSIILVGDGASNTGDPTQDACNDAAADGYTICAIAIAADQSGQDELEACALATGGAFGVADSFDDFETVCPECFVFILLCECLNPVVGTDPGVCTASVDCDQIANCTDLFGNPANVSCNPSGPYPLGVTGVTVTATKEGSQTVTHDCQVTVFDDEPPEITCPPDVTITCGDSSDPADTGSATATDNCDDPTISYDDVEVPAACPADPIMFTIVRTWTATDAAGNQSSCVQNITVLKRVGALDIKPASCPNPYNPGGRGSLPVGLLGTADFDVTEVNLATVRISRGDCVGGTVAPEKSTLSDVGTPFPGALCDCHTLAGDGVLDLWLRFSEVDVTTTLGLDALPPGTVELVITGRLSDGCAFVARDCIRVGPKNSL